MLILTCGERHGRERHALAQQSRGAGRSCGCAAAVSCATGRTFRGRRAPGGPAPAMSAPSVPRLFEYCVIVADGGTVVRDCFPPASCEEDEVTACCTASSIPCAPASAIPPVDSVPARALTGGGPDRIYCGSFHCSATRNAGATGAPPRPLIHDHPTAALRDSDHHHRRAAPRARSPPPPSASGCLAGSLVLTNAWGQRRYGAHIGLPNERGQLCLLSRWPVYATMHSALLVRDTAFALHLHLCRVFPLLRGG